MFDIKKLEKVLELFSDYEIPEALVYTIVWAGESEEAQEILSAKRADCNFYDDLYEFLKKVNYADYEELQRLVNHLELNVNVFDQWAKMKGITK